MGQIQAIQKQVKYRYGSPRVREELNKRIAYGTPVGHNRVARLMAKHGLGARPRKKHRVTTDSDHDLTVAENLLARHFEVDRPNAVWAGDISYVATGEGWLYLAVVIDLYSRQVVGWSLGTSLAAELEILSVPDGLSHPPTAARAAVPLAIGACSTPAERSARS